MKKLLLAASALIALAGPALAADLPSRKEAVLPPPPPPMWTGFYAGLNAGYGFAGSQGVSTSGVPAAIPYDDPRYTNGALVSPFSYSSIDNSGFIGGAQFGYNWQYGSSFVMGLETDIQGTGMNGTSLTNSVAPLTGCFQEQCKMYTSVNSYKSLDFLGTVRGRIGYLATPTLLIYGTGGFAYGGGRFSSYINGNDAQCWYCTLPATANLTSNSLLTGYAAGGGFEWMFMPNWSLKAEYLYFDLGSVTNTGYQAFNDAYNTNELLVLNQVKASTRFNGNIARAGVNYHFNWGAAPIVAKF